MCWSATASVTMVAIGGGATVLTLMRGEPKAIWLTLGFFTAMEALQAVGYAVVDNCGSPANRTITLLSYLHIAFQPLFINAFAMAIAPAAVSRRRQRQVYAIAAASTAILLFQLAPIEAFGVCAPGSALCGPAACLYSGEWHIAWALPLNGLMTGIGETLGLPIEFPSYIFAVFLLPLWYGAWRFVLFHALVGPILAMALTSDPNEMPAIWCLFSIGIALISLSRVIRHRVMAAHVPRAV